MDNLKINSLEYWENRFQNNWEEMQGIQQTEFFAHIACELFPNWFVRKIREQRYSICDMGCAMGEGVAILSQFFGYNITGVDFSGDAIKIAKKRQPEQEFFTMDLKKINQDKNYDIAFLSNVLEHFDRPWNILENISKITNNYIVILVPFEEKMQVDEHIYKFKTDNIPLEVNQFRLINARSLDCAQIERTFYADKQIMLIYSSCQEDYERTYFSDLMDNVVTNNHTMIQNLYFQINEGIQKENVLLQQLNEKNELIARIEEKQMLHIKEINNYKIKLCNSRIENEKLENSIEILNKEKEFISKEKETLELDKKWIEDEKEKMSVKNDNLNQELLKLKNSFSWRSTKFMRAISKLVGFSKLHQKMRVARVQVREGNTWRNILLYKMKNSKIFPLLKKIIPAKLRNKMASKYHATYIPQVDNRSLREKVFEFCDNIKNEEQVLLVYSGVQYIDSEGQRNIRLVHEALQMGIKVIFVNWRWDQNEKVNEETKGNQMIQIPIDIFCTFKSEFFENCLKANRKKIFLIEFPHQTAIEMIDIANCFNWTTIYDVIDDWEEFSKKGQAIWYNKEVEYRIANQVDINIATADRLREKILKETFRKDNYYLISNGVDPSRMKKSKKLKNYDMREGDLQIGYFGHLTDAWFDWEMLKKIAYKRPNWTFHLIGYGEPKKLKIPKNIKLYGKKEPEELPKYAAYWNVAMIPFINCELTLGVNPIKIYEYLQLGLPTVASNMPEVRKFPYTQIAIGEEEFQNAIIEASKISLDTCVIEEFIEKNTWKCKLQELLNYAKEENSKASYKQIF